MGICEVRRITPDNLPRLEYQEPIYVARRRVEEYTPLQLMTMLYDRALRRMEAARAALLARDQRAQKAHLERAQAIVVELMACLDVESEREIVSTMLSLYQYVLSQLMDASERGEVAPIERSIKVFAELRASWAKLEIPLGSDRKAA